jgi:hypothetical protein
MDFLTTQFSPSSLLDPNIVLSTFYAYLYHDWSLNYLQPTTVDLVRFMPTYTTTDLLTTCSLPRWISCVLRLLIPWSISYVLRLLTHHGWYCTFYAYLYHRWSCTFYAYSYRVDLQRLTPTYTTGDLVITYFCSSFEFPTLIPNQNG